MSASLAPLASGTSILATNVATGGLTGFISTAFRQWLLQLTGRLQKAPYWRAVKTLTLQAAAIVTTSVWLTDAEGLYEVSYVLRVTQAATTSSSATVTLGWVRGGISIPQAFAALTGNTTGTQQNGRVFVRADRATDLTVAVAYASVGATPMQFEIDVVVTQVN